MGWRRCGLVVMVVPSTVTAMVGVRTGWGDVEAEAVVGREVKRKQKRRSAGVSGPARPF